MRVAPTPSEALLWAALKNRQLGCRFRRQVILGRYIVDFFAPTPRLVIEIDGAYHNTDADRRRDAFLNSRAFRILRLTTHAVENDFTNSIRKIQQALT